MSNYSFKAVTLLHVIPHLSLFYFIYLYPHIENLLHPTLTILY